MSMEKPLYNYDLNVWLRTCDEEVSEPLEGKLTGTIPSWIQGSLIRNGPGCTKIGDCKYLHVFDGLALLHRFAIKNGRATYQCRFLRSETYKKNTAANRIVVTEFATKAVPDPCHTIFDRISSVFDFKIEWTDNTMISVYPFGDQIYTLTETPVFYKIDPDSLETLDKELLSESLIVSHTAHPHVMPNGDVYNVGINKENGVSYVVVKFTNSEKGDMFDTAEIVGKVKARWQLNPSYMHSFGVTDNYFIIIEQPLCISLLNTMRRYIIDEPIVYSMVSYPEYETEVVLIHRETGVTTRYIVDTIFFMHIINCFEQDGKVIIDLCSYKDGKIIDAMYYEAIKQSRDNNPDYGQCFKSRPKRIEIPLDVPPLSRLETKLIVDFGIEMPRINYEVYNGRPYKYFYGIGCDIDAEIVGSIVKVDNQTGKFKMWYQPNWCPSEPIFISHPDAKEEDDGVLLSAVLSSEDDQAIILIILNAKDLVEIARVEFVTPSPSPRCFHGWYFPDKTS